MTKIIKPDTYDISMLIDCLNSGGLIVYPTDTIYGIAASVNNIKAIERIYSVKNRSTDKPLSICLHSKSDISKYCHTNNFINEIIDKLLPGKYTLLLNKKIDLPKYLVSNNTIIAVRVPDNKISHDLTRTFPITTTSANISNQPTENSVEKIRKQLKYNIDYYIDSGVINQKASTIIDLTRDYPKLVRTESNNENLEKILETRLY